MNITENKRLNNMYKIKEITSEYIIMESGVVYPTHTHYIFNNCIMNINGCLVVQLNKTIDKWADSAING